MITSLLPVGLLVDDFTTNPTTLRHLLILYHLNPLTGLRVVVVVAVGSLNAIFLINGLLVGKVITGVLRDISEDIWGPLDS